MDLYGPQEGKLYHFQRHIEKLTILFSAHYDNYNISIVTKRLKRVIAQTRPKCMISLNTVIAEGAIEVYLAKFSPGYELQVILDRVGNYLVRVEGPNRVVHETPLLSLEEAKQTANALARRFFHDYNIMERPIAAECLEWRRVQI